MEHLAAEPAVPERLRGIRSRRRVAREGRCGLGMGREVRRRQLPVPRMRGVQGAVGQPVTADDVARPVVEEPHVGLGPDVLREQGPVAQLGHVGAVYQRRSERHGRDHQGVARR